MCVVTSPVNTPLHSPDTCKTIPHPLCRGIASSGCALGPRHLLLCFLGPQAELDLPCLYQKNVLPMNVQSSQAIITPV